MKVEKSEHKEELPYAAKMTFLIFSSQSQNCNERHFLPNCDLHVKIDIGYDHRIAVCGTVVSDIEQMSISPDKNSITIEAKVTYRVLKGLLQTLDQRMTSSVHMVIRPIKEPVNPLHLQ